MKPMDPPSPNGDNKVAQSIQSKRIINDAFSYFLFYFYGIFPVIVCAPVSKVQYIPQPYKSNVADKKKVRTVLSKCPIKIMLSIFLRP